MSDRRGVGRSEIRMLQASLLYVLRKHCQHAYLAHSLASLLHWQLGEEASALANEVSRLEQRLQVMLSRFRSWQGITAGCRESRRIRETLVAGTRVSWRCRRLLWCCHATVGEKPGGCGRDQSLCYRIGRAELRMSMMETREGGLGLSREHMCSTAVLVAAC